MSDMNVKIILSSHELQNVLPLTLSMHSIANQKQITVIDRTSKGILYT